MARILACNKGIAYKIKDLDIDTLSSEPNHIPANLPPSRIVGSWNEQGTHFLCMYYHTMSWWDVWNNASVRHDISGAAGGQNCRGWGFGCAGGR